MQGYNISWSPPSRGVLKLNMDAHFIRDGRWSVGMILRREDGGTVVVATRVVRSDNDATLAEAIGIQEALKLILQHKVEPIIIESDSQVTIQALRGKDGDMTYWGKIIWSYIQTCGCSKIDFRWTRRSGNKAAHEFARWATIESNRD